MDKLTNQALDQLIKDAPAGPVATIYIPMHTTGSPPHISENQIRFKNLLHAALAELESLGESTKAFCDRLRQFQETKLEDTSFFERQSPGLLICASRQEVRLFSLPVDTEEYVAVDDQFHLAPVMGLAHEAVEYYVLSVGQQNPRLYIGDLYGLSEAGIELPASIAKGLDIDENNLKSEHALSAGGSSLNTNAFNGRGGAKNPQEDDRIRYFRLLDAIIMKKADRSLPLVLAGIDAETAEFRAHSKYPRILHKSIGGGSRGRGTISELSAPSLAIIREEVIAPRQARMIEHFQALHGAHPERVALEEPALETAAQQGRIETLLLRMTRQTHDTIRDTLDTVTQITFPEKKLSFALNKLAMKVANMSGTILSLDATKMPSSGPAVASLRF